MKIWSMPIKGTVQVKENNWKEAWEWLKKCPKNSAELLMITDLLANDLSSLEQPHAKIITPKAPLKVPGLLHQYSLVSANCSYNVSLGKIIKGLFPGGSVTGAPKKRSMEIISKLEKRNRIHYCGSTILIHDQILAASINIRSAIINPLSHQLLYQAGGGITLKSQLNSEYHEMIFKVKSFGRAKTL